ncbi:hypothetical protein AB0G05_26845 [Nonomuraea wenchangensis]
MSENEVTASLLAIGVWYESFDRPEPLADWAPMGSVQGFGYFIPRQVEKYLAEQGFEDGMVQHVLYVAPDDDGAHERARRFRRQPGVKGVYVEAFECEPELVEAVRRAAVNPEWPEL